MKTEQNVNEPLPASGLFAVGDVFTFIADHHEVTWTVFALTEYDVRLDRPSGGRVRGPMIIGRESLRIALSEDRARRVEPASDEIIRTHQMACAARLECEELREALRKAVAWGESASRHILYRENINWRYLDEARAVLDKANDEMRDGERKTSATTTSEL